MFVDESLKVRPRGRDFEVGGSDTCTTVVVKARWTAIANLEDPVYNNGIFEDEEAIRCSFISLIGVRR